MLFSHIFFFLFYTDLLIYVIIIKRIFKSDWCTSFLFIYIYLFIHDSILFLKIFKNIWRYEDTSCNYNVGARELSQEMRVSEATNYTPIAKKTRSCHQTIRIKWPLMCVTALSQPKATFIPTYPWNLIHLSYIYQL